MSSSPHIVPPKPTEYRVMRRRKAWFFGWATCVLAGLSLLLLVDEISVYWVIGCVCLTAISGIAALVFRFIEQPREITVRRFPNWPPVIHFHFEKPPASPEDSSSPTVPGMIRSADGHSRRFPSP